MNEDTRIQKLFPALHIPFATIVFLGVIAVVTHIAISPYLRFGVQLKYIAYLAIFIGFLVGIVLSLVNTITNLFMEAKDDWLFASVVLSLIFMFFPLPIGLINSLVLCGALFLSSSFFTKVIGTIVRILVPITEKSKVVSEEATETAGG